MDVVTRGHSNFFFSSGATVLVICSVVFFEVNISLAFFHCVGIALHPRPFVSDIAICAERGR